ncbi:autotransporter domain-containing protein, partial [Candidatus Pelagibacter ubique]|nr:autotransporter domain-containing protein [Candidatus Pelagibacter ubique]
MKKILKISFFVFSFLALFYSNAFAFLEFQKEKILSTDVPGVRGINFKPDGSIMYITNRVDNRDAYMVQYSLSTPFDISTATRTFVDGAGTKLTCSTDMELPHAIEFKPDGTRMFITTNKDHSGGPGVAVYQFKLTTAWDTSTLDCEKIYEVNITGSDNEDQVRTLTFKPDGTRMFVGGKDQDQIREYILTTPFDLRSGVSVGSLSARLESSSDASMRNIQLHSDGTILYVAGDDNNKMHKYTLSTPWDITTISSTSTEYDLGSRVSHMRGFIFTANFTKLFVTNDAGSSASTNKIFEYSLDCAGTITCSDASANADVKAIIEANVELSKRIIKNNTLPIFHRIEWLRRHKNKDNLSNLNAEIDFTNEKISKLVTALKSSKKEVDRSYDSDDWFQWSEGRVSLGKNKSINSSSRDFHSYGISVGADKIKDDDRDAMHGYVFQYANDNVDIGYKGSKLETDAYSFALYGTKLRDDHVFTDALIGVSLLDIDQKRVIYDNILEGNREGQQIYGSFNFGKRIVDEDLNLNPGIKLDLGYTKLKAFREKSNVANSLTDALLYKEQNIKSALVTLGVLLDKTDTDKEED